MKRKLALFMVVAMLISLVPMNVFAGSTNTVNTVPSVKVDQQATVTLNFEEKVNTDFATGDQFRIDITNADIVSITGATVSTTANSAIVTMGAMDSSTGSDKDMIALSVTFEVTEEANVTVDISSLGTGITSQDGLIIAKGTAGATKSKVSGTQTITETATALKTISIEELSKSSLANGDKAKVKLPANFKWTSAGTVSTYGEITSASATINTDTRELTVEILGYTAGSIGGILLTGTEIQPTSDAKLGDVNVSVSSIVGDFTSESFLVGTYTDYGVTVKLDKESVPTLVSGQYSSDSDDVKLQTLVIKEDVANSLIDGRKFKVTFPDDVKITAYDTTKDAAHIVTATDTDYAPDNDNSVEFVVQTNTAKAEIKIKFYVSVAADFAGDITANLSGRALPTDYNIVLGKAVKPATFTVAPKDLKIGLQNQAVGTIVITEPEAGYWKVNEKVFVSFPDDFDADGSPTITVTKGDLEIKDENKTDDFYFTVKSESDAAPAEVTLTGGTVKVNRNVAEGDYKVNIKGSAIAHNYDADAENAKFDVNGVGSQIAFRVITPAPGDTKAGEKVVFTIGSADYMVGAATMTSDAAPYINENGRTMLPLRALANALGVSDANIMWNDMEHSVTIFKGDATVKVTIGEMSFVKNGVVVPMDTQAVIMNSRTFLPIRAIGQALGAEVLWDEATRTVTVQ